MICSVLLFASFLMVDALHLPLMAQQVVHVDASATGANVGSSWSDAFVHLQDAIDDANVNASADYEIQIAEGTYYPGDDNVAQIDGITGPSEDVHFSDDRSETFIIARDNISFIF